MRLDLDRLRVWGVGAFAALSVASVFAFLTLDWWDHRLAPRPTGAVLRVELPEEQFFFGGPFFRVAALDRDGPAIAVLWGGRYVSASAAPEPYTLLVVRYPSGEVLERTVGPSRKQLDEFAAGSSTTAARRFDFDGDGVEDRAKCGNRGRAWVESGATGVIFWAQREELEYENWERLTPLGDLDGDGCSELAVIHPRQDRSKYDFELFDAVFGATSWLTVVSGARATRR